MAHRLVERLQRVLAAARTPAEQLALHAELARQHARVLDLESAHESLDQARRLLEHTPLPAQTDELRHAVATVLYVSGQLHPAITELGHARAAAVQARHPHWIARCDAMMVLFLARFGAHDAGRGYARRALDEARAIDDAQALYTVWLGLGALARNACDACAARAAYANARQYAGILDDDLAVRMVLQHLVGLTIERARMGLLGADEVPAAHAEVATSFMFAEHHGSQIGMVQARIALAMLDRAIDRPQSAAESLDALADQAESLSMLEEAIVARIELARARRALADPAGAQQAARKACERAERAGILRLQLLATQALAEQLDVTAQADQAAQLGARVEVLRERTAQLQRDGLQTLRALIGRAPTGGD